MKANYPTSIEKINERKQKIKLLDKKKWLKSKARFSGSQLLIGGLVAMSSWEKPYMKRLAEIAALNGGKILEIGFGMGLASNFIEHHKIVSHTIIEPHPDVVKKAVEWKNLQKHPERIKIIKGFWQDVAGDFKDGEFDGILFDTYPMTEKEIHRNHFPFLKYAHRLLKKGGILTYYSDEVKDFSGEHLSVLKKAGFSSIKAYVCRVKPPKNCEYWEHKTIVAPEIRKT